MFILTKIADLVQIQPVQFLQHSRVAIENIINTKYSNRVIQNIGLCICLYDLLWSSEGMIGHGNGLVNVNVEFRLIVFRPFRMETIFAQISSSTPEGIHLRTKFFEEIFVPYKELPADSEYDHNEKAWVWVTEDDRAVYDKNEMCRVQVIDEVWHDQTPEDATEESIEKAKKVSPYRIIGSMREGGLGVCLWWDYEEDGGDGHGGDEDNGQEGEE